WGYDQGAETGQRDNSNTQYALLALWAARNHRIGKDDGQKDELWKDLIGKEFWEQVRLFYTQTQTDNGGWGYGLGRLGPGEILTMTTAGLSGLLMSQMERSSGRENEDPVKICGIYEEDAAIKKAWHWLWSQGADRFKLKLDDAAFYNVYGIERLGRLSGQRFIGPHDWYREGCTWLVKNQKDDGHWALPGSWDSNPTVSTSFALLFLSKGRTPVLISKLAHGPTPRQENDQDWNRRRNDLRHLVDYASAKVFKGSPLAWQNFDMRRLQVAGPEQIREVTADLLQSPILYITGHQSPMTRFTDFEKTRLKEYVDNGGFILAVACCGAKEFSDGFSQLCQELWPYNDLTVLPPDHAVWNMAFPIKPGVFNLKGIQLGCKTPVILCTDNMCGLWEINRRTGDGEPAFQLGANIIAYATGMDPPKPRLTLVPVTLAGKDEVLLNPKRGYFQVGQLISKIGEEADWKPAPEAMSKLMQHMRDAAGLDVVIKTANVPIDHKDLTKYKFLYMHGRKDFRFTSQQLEKLRFNLKNGGLLLADACCGKEAFDKAFRQFITDLFPKEAFEGGEPPRLEPIPVNDVLFSKELNGKALDDNTIKYRVERGKELKSLPPSLEGVKIGNRWVVIYSKYDIGCALEKHQSADCLGYNYDSALALAKAAVLYHFRP
ncbi:MAG TPA: DUF4159 domain-containing protein, partial [Gemmataceae bacterium]|nr:DUF4159 domain-containing protein [Gemmataceae bacterium]